MFKTLRLVISILPVYAEQTKRILRKGPQSLWETRLCATLLLDSLAGAGGGPPLVGRVPVVKLTRTHHNAPEVAQPSSHCLNRCTLAQTLCTCVQVLIRNVN
jgi:hypothetical protein